MATMGKYVVLCRPAIGLIVLYHNSETLYTCKREQIKLIWTRCHKNTALNESNIYVGTY